MPDLKAVTRSEAIAFCENAFRNIEQMMSLSPADIDDIAGALTSFLNTRPSDGWQGMGSAPKMRSVLLWADTSTPDHPNWKMGSGFYHSGMNCWIWEGEQVRDWAFPPTHWMPLPPPPKEPA